MGFWSHFTMTKTSPKTVLHQPKRTELLTCAFLQQKRPLRFWGEGNCFTVLCYFLPHNNICDSPCLQDWDHIISLIYMLSHHISENLPCSVCFCVCVGGMGWGEGIPHATKQLSDTSWVSKIQLNSDCLPADSIRFYTWRAQFHRPYPHYTNFRCPSQVQVCPMCFWWTGCKSEVPVSLMNLLEQLTGLRNSILPRSLLRKRI